MEGAGPGREGQGESRGETGEEGGATAPARPPAMRITAAEAACVHSGNALPVRRWCRCPCRRRWTVRTP